ncbi:MAG: ribosomal L7Ae/L30e/S12e/Gadd45 family protein [Oscillospiraceae bacterium]|jgi:ribosomal protein L7Ae-like RNA K-turn-binding protein|nr:ribosomal L7Ae/L30e/S12e/Gadd45 family protein [Oscillospiraceae bacterium]
MNKSLGLLAISRKGKNLVCGEDAVAAAARASRARLVILAEDAGGHTVRRAKSAVAGTAQPLITVPFSKDDLGEVLGVSSCAVAAITDVRLAQAFVKTLDRQEKYEALLADLEVRVERVKKRREEEKAHERNVRRGEK